AFITSNKNNLTLDQIIGKISYTNNSGRLIKNISPVINSGGKYLSWEDTIPDNTMTAVLYLTTTNNNSSIISVFTIFIMPDLSTVFLATSLTVLYGGSLVKLINECFVISWNQKQDIITADENLIKRLK
ncbi:20845_t:CDS:2, partial [Entrophospora sp. SA101]